MGKAFPFLGRTYGGEDYPIAAGWQAVINLVLVTRLSPTGGWAIELQMLYLLRAGLLGGRRND